MPGPIIIVIMMSTMNRCCVTIMMTSMISVVVVVMMTTINTNCHYSPSCIIRRVICIVIGRIIGHIYWRVDILYYCCWFNNHNGCCVGRGGGNWLRTSIPGIRSNCGNCSSFGFNNIIFTIQIFISYDLHSSFSIFILWY